MITERQLTIFQTMVQSAVIHPEWDAADHASYLVFDAFYADPERLGYVTDIVRQVMARPAFARTVVLNRTWPR